MLEKGTCGKGGVGGVEEITGEKMAGGQHTMWERRQQDRYCRFAWCYWGPPQILRMRPAVTNCETFEDVRRLSSAGRRWWQGLRSELAFEMMERTGLMSFRCRWPLIKLGVRHHPLLLPLIPSNLPVKNKFVFV